MASGSGAFRAISKLEAAMKVASVLFQEPLDRIQTGRTVAVPAAICLGCAHVVQGGMPWPYPEICRHRSASRDGPGDCPACVIAFVAALQQSFDCSTHARHGVCGFIGPPTIAKCCVHFFHPAEVTCCLPTQLNVRSGRPVSIVATSYKLPLAAFSSDFRRVTPAR